MEKKLKVDMGESHETKSKTLRPLKAVAKVIGILLIFFGFLVLVLSYAVKYLLENGYTEEELERIFLIVFLVGWLFFGGGLGLCFGVSIVTLPSQTKIDNRLDQYFKNREKPTKSIRFFSFRWSKFLAAIFLLFLGFLNLFIITGAISHHNPPYGNAVVLGGPSFYYVMAFFPHGFGIGLLLYAILHSHKANVGRSENYFYYNQFKKNSTVNTALPKTEIEMIQYQNININKNYAWVLTLVPFSVLTAIQGVYLLMAPMLTDPTQGILFLVTAVLEIVALYFLALRPAHNLKVTTKENLYETWFTPYKEKITEIPIPEEDRIGKINTEFMNENKISPTHKHYTRLLIGIFFLASGLVMLIFYYVIHIFGYWYTMVSIIFGTLLIIKATVNDFSDKNGVLVDYNKEDKTLNFERTSRSHFVKINTLQSTDLEVSNQFRRLNVFELLLIPILLAFSTIQTVQSWVLSTSPTLIINSVITTAFLCLVYFLIFIHVCVPIDQLRVKTPTLKYNIPITLTDRKKRFLEGVKPFSSRGLFIIITGVSSVIGILIYLNLYFFI